MFISTNPVSRAEQYQSLTRSKNKGLSKPVFLGGFIRYGFDEAKAAERDEMPSF